MTDLRHQVPPRDEDYPLKAQVPDRMWIWNKETDFNAKKPSKKYLSEYTEVLVATPPRLHAEELVEALRDLTQTVYTEHFDAALNAAIALLASIEQESKP